MSPKKLSDADKQEILDLYRQSDETTSTLAERYGVSSSTISRFLKNELSPLEYEDLIQQKRLARTPYRGEKSTVDVQPTKDVVVSQPSKPLGILSSAIANTILSNSTPVVIKPEIKLKPKEVESDEEEFVEEEEIDEDYAIALEEMLGEDLSDDEDDDDEDDDDEDDDWDPESEREFAQSLSKSLNVKVLPISEADFPRICYLVVDRSSELITRPLRDFADLGTIPSQEIQQRTLPVFDNHRVAKRFSHRRERVIKVPDGQMLQKTSSYLQAKGISRLLIDGQIYSL